MYCDKLVYKIVRNIWSAMQKKLQPPFCMREKSSPECVKKSPPQFHILYTQIQLLFMKTVFL